MRTGDIGKWLRLVAWYLGFFHLWLLSAVYFLAYVHVYDRFRLISRSLVGEASPQLVWSILLSEVCELQEPLLLATHCAFLAGILFSFEEGEGYSYLRHTAGFKGLEVYAAKWLSCALLATTPHVTAKILTVAVWDYRLLLNQPAALLVPSLRLAMGSLIVVSYLYSVYSLWALLLRRAVYFVIATFLELYLLEGLWGPLMLVPMTLALVNPLHGLSAALSAYWPWYTASVIHLLAAMYLQSRGEVRWR